MTRKKDETVRGRTQNDMHAPQDVFADVESLFKEKTMIPKTIHYCWFGGSPLPELARKCIASWRKIFRQYSFAEEDRI